MQRLGCSSDRHVPATFLRMSISNNHGKKHDGELQVTCSRSSSDTCNGGTCSCSTLPSSIVHVMLTTLTLCLHLRVRGRFSKLYCKTT